MQYVQICYYIYIELNASLTSGKGVDNGNSDDEEAHCKFHLKFGKKTTPRSRFSNDFLSNHTSNMVIIITITQHSFYTNCAIY